jgi:uncharacterized protein (TIGR02145 family)
MRVGAMYALQENKPGDTIAILKAPIIAVPQNEPTGMGVQFSLNTAEYFESGSVFRFEWTITASGGGYDPTPYLQYTGSKQESVFVPYDGTSRTYTARVRAISEGYNDSPVSEPVTSGAGKFVPSYDLVGEPYYDIAYTDYFTNSGGTEKRYGYIDLRALHALSSATPYEYKIVGKGLNPTYSWSINGAGNEYASIEGSTTNSVVKIRFASSVTYDPRIANQPDASLPVKLQCVVKDGSFEHTYTIDIQIGDRDVCSATLPYKDAEGNTYFAYRFGDAGCWMTQNLRSTYTIQNGIKQSLIENPNNSNTDPHYNFPSKSRDTLTAHPEYGLLYNWPAANVGTAPAESSDAYRNGAPGLPSDRQGICPSGWVVPSDWDWAQLEKEIASHPEKYSSHTNAYTSAATFDYYTTLGHKLRYQIIEISSLEAT